MSIERVNMATQYLLNGAFETIACTGSAWALEYISPLQGALFGAVQYISKKAIHYTLRQILDLNNPDISVDAKLLIGLMANVAGVACGVFALMYYNVTLGFTQTVYLVAGAIAGYLPLKAFHLCVRGGKAAVDFCANMDAIVCEFVENEYV